MALPELTRKLIEKKIGDYCEWKVPSHVKQKIRIGFKIRGNSVTIIEERPYFHVPSQWSQNVVAQFRYDPSDHTWALYCADRNSRWCLYSRSVPTKNIDTLLRWVEADPTGIFWG
jgi:DUF3024 family protein